MLPVLSCQTDWVQGVWHMRKPSILTSTRGVSNWPIRPSSGPGLPLRYAPLGMRQNMRPVFLCWKSPISLDCPPHENGCVPKMLKLGSSRALMVSCA